MAEKVAQGAQGAETMKEEQKVDWSISVKQNGKWRSAEKYNKQLGGIFSCMTVIASRDTLKRTLGSALPFCAFPCLSVHIQQNFSSQRGLDAVIDVMTVSIESSSHPVMRNATVCTADVL